MLTILAQTIFKKNKINIDRIDYTHTQHSSSSILETWSEHSSSSIQP